MPLPIFQYWLRKYRKENSNTEAFISIESNEMPGIIHIRYPNGVEVILPVGIKHQTLHSLISLH